MSVNTNDLSCLLRANSHLFVKSETKAAVVMYHLFSREEAYPRWYGDERKTDDK